MPRLPAGSLSPSRGSRQVNATAIDSIHPSTLFTHQLCSLINSAHLLAEVVAALPPPGRGRGSPRPLSIRPTIHPSPLFIEPYSPIASIHHSLITSLRPSTAFTAARGGTGSAQPPFSLINPIPPSAGRARRKVAAALLPRGGPAGQPAAAVRPSTPFCAAA
jgi:hypothetical protein